MNTLYIVPNNGLCNRLRTISSSLAFCARYGYMLKVVWMPGVDRLKFSNFAEQQHRFEIIEDQYEAKKTIEKLNEKFNCRIGDCELKILALNGDILYNSCQPFTTQRDYSWLKFNDRIVSAAVKIINEQILVGSYIGMHIRRTDQVKSVMFSPISIFENKIRSLIEKDQQIKIYVASDSDEEKNYLKEKFNDNVIVRINNIKRGKENFELDACIDFLILSKSKYLYKSYWSSFSDEAALYGNIKSEILKI